LQAVDLLRSTGKIVKLKLARYMKGSKFEPTSEESAEPIAKVSNISTADVPRFMNGSTVIQVNNQGFDGNQTQQLKAPKSTNEVIEKWASIVGAQFDIIVSVLFVTIVLPDL